MTPHRLKIWHGAILGYFAIAIFLFTLNPFQFQPYTQSEFWVWRFSIEDFSRNVLLFSPFGLACRYVFSHSHSRIVVYGFLLSLAVELLQLFVEIRTSNIVDLISNSSGTLIGSLVCYWMLEQRNEKEQKASTHTVTYPLSRDFSLREYTALNVLLSFAYVPLCWASAMMLRRSPAVLLIILCSAIAAFALIQSGHQFASLTQHRKHRICAIW
ncbi:MAG: VanZ family protein, partial [Cyanobacteria bacterium J06632_3]